jgi:DNA-directed RNA polymerase subunit omega
VAKGAFAKRGFINRPSAWLRNVARGAAARGGDIRRFTGDLFLVSSEQLRSEALTTARHPMRDDYLQSARKVIEDPNILINVVSLRVKQLRRGSRPLVESLEKLSPEDTALREIAEGKITYQLATAEELARL